MVPSGPLLDPLSLRTACLRDRADLVSMMKAFNTEDQIVIDENVLAHALQHLLGDRNLGRIWFIEGGRRCLGYAVLTFGFDLEFGGRDAFLTEFYLLPHERGRGAGRAALRAIEAEARTLGVRAIHLGVRPENARACRLYKKAGYETQPRDFLTKRLGTEERQ